MLTHIIELKYFGPIAIEDASAYRH